MKKEFSLTQFLTGAVCFVVFVGLTVVCLSGPLLDAVDKWCDNPDNQIIIAGVSTGVLLAVGVKWFINRLKG